MDLKKDLLRGINSIGFKQPTSIQQLTIILALGGKHIMAQSQPGTGKTTALCISTLQQIEHSSYHTQAIIMAVTRDHAYEIEKLLKELGQYMEVKVCVCVGGTPLWQERCNLRGAQIVVGTHGKILGLVKRHIIDITFLKTLVLDEADGLLAKDPSQIEEMEDITQRLLPSTQIMFFSAAIPSEVECAGNSILHNPARIFVEKDARIFEGVHQYYLYVEEEEKSKALAQQLNQTVKQIIIYCDGHEMVKFLETDLRRRGFTISPVHSKMDQEERRKSVNDFFEEKTSILITTNLIGRGLKLKTVSLVINYDMPPTLVDYAHRLAHLGPVGKRSGVVLSLVATEDDIEKIKQLEKCYDTTIGKFPASIESMVV